eukprot:tig00020911_g15718.t1
MGRDDGVARFRRVVTRKVDRCLAGRYVRKGILLERGERITPEFFDPSDPSEHAKVSAHIREDLGISTGDRVAPLMYGTPWGSPADEPRTAREQAKRDAALRILLSGAHQHYTATEKQPVMPLFGTETASPCCCPVCYRTLAVPVRLWLRDQIDLRTKLAGADGAVTATCRCGAHLLVPRPLTPEERARIARDMRVRISGGTATAGWIVLGSIAILALLAL